MTSRIGVHTVPFVGFRIRCILKKLGAEVDGASMRCLRIGHMEVDMDLLRCPVRPIGPNVVRGTLHTDEPIPLFVDDAMEPWVLVNHRPVEHGSPK